MPFDRSRFVKNENINAAKIAIGFINNNLIGRFMRKLLFSSIE